jgi:hypothetical protein
MLTLMEHSARIFPFSVAIRYNCTLSFLFIIDIDFLSIYLIQNSCLNM